MKKVLSMLLMLCGVAAYSQNVQVDWTTDPVDAHRTGVKASNASNVAEAMGYVKGKTYHAPNGKKFRGSTAKAASIMLEAQPAMAKVKQSIGYSTRYMERGGLECEIYDWYIDELMRAVADSTGKKVDVGIANRGGVRVDMPQGDVLYDDIMSMFPFRNRICYVALRGKELRSIFDEMAKSFFQIIGGAKITAHNGRLVSVIIDGEPLDDDKLYGVATVDFLLDGGDGLKLGKNSEETIHCNGYLYDTILAYVASLTAQGKPIEFENQHWLTVIGEGDDE